MEPLLSQGVELMFIGMGIVFLFLILLVFTTGAMSRLVNRYFPEVPAPKRAAASAPAVAAGQIPATHVVAIREAVRQHRSRH